MNSRTPAQRQAAWRARHQTAAVEVGAVTVNALDRIAARDGHPSRAATVARLASDALGRVADKETNV